MAWDEEPAGEPAEIDEVQEEEEGEVEAGRRAAAPWAAVKVLEGAGLRGREGS